MPVKRKPQNIEVSSCYMVGTLASDNKNLPAIGEEQLPVTPVKNSFGVVFYITPLSPDPEPIFELDLRDPRTRNEQIYIGFDNQDVFPPGFLDVTYNHLNPYEKAEYISNKLKDKLILFQPILKSDTKQPDKLRKNLKIIALEDSVGFSNDSSFVPVPKVEITINDFENTILSKDKVIFNDYNHLMTPPEYIICGDFLYVSDYKGGWIADPSQNTAWVHKDSESVKKVELPKDFTDNIASEVTNNLVFVDVLYLNKIAQQTKAYPIGSDIFRSNSEDQAELTANENPTNSDTSDNNSRYNRMEIHFIFALEKNATRENLFYNQMDLYNFHTSVKTNDLTILAGMSGTGKTKLALTYAKTLGLERKNGTLLVLPISPAYTEPGDVLGYLNSSTGLYIPSETGLVDILIHADKHRDQMHMVIFDEMNLSQVEHWFAPFMSLLEINGDNRLLYLYSEKTRCHNDEKYPPKIHIHNNILFVGTVNMDETTRDFSDRLLDRANIVILQKNKFLQLKNESPQNTLAFGNSEDDIPSEVYSKVNHYRSWLYYNSKWDAVFSDKELIFFDELHQMLNEIDPQKGVSFRVLDCIGNYINNIPESQESCPLLDRKLAIDLQLKQRIMTKIRGTIEQYGTVIGTLPNLQDEKPQSSSLFDLFTSKEAQGISDFTYSIREIKRKARELYLNGYAT